MTNVFSRCTYRLRSRLVGWLAFHVRFSQRIARTLVRLPDPCLLAQTPVVVCKVSEPPVLGYASHWVWGPSARPHTHPAVLWSCCHYVRVGFHVFFVLGHVRTAVAMEPPHCTAPQVCGGGAGRGGGLRDARRPTGTEDTSSGRAAKHPAGLPFHSPDLHLDLPCGLVRGEVPCALPRMRS